MLSFMTSTLANSKGSSLDHENDGAPMSILRTARRTLDDGMLSESPKFHPDLKSKIASRHDVISATDSDLSDGSSCVDDKSPSKQESKSEDDLFIGKDADTMDGAAAMLHFSTARNDLPEEFRCHHKEPITNLTNQAKWNRSFQRLKEFKERYGHCKVPPRLDRALSVWVNNQRYQLRSSRRCQRNQSRINQLDSIGFNWSFESQPSSDKNVPSGTIPVTTHQNHDDGKVPGPRSASKQNSSVGKIEQVASNFDLLECATTMLGLSNSGNSPIMNFNINHYCHVVEAQHCTHRNNNVEHVLEHDDCDWSRSRFVQRPQYSMEGIDWMHRMRCFWKASSFSHSSCYDSTIQSRVDQANFRGSKSPCVDTDVALNIYQRESSRMTALLSHEVPSADGSTDDINERIETAKKGSKKSENTNKYNQHEINWLLWFDRLKEYQAQYGHCRVSRKQDKALYTWASNQRQNRHLSRRYRQKRIDLLNSIGFQWGTKKHSPTLAKVDVDSTEVQSGTTYLDFENKDPFKNYSSVMIDEIGVHESISPSNKSTMSTSSIFRMHSLLEDGEFECSDVTCNSDSSIECDVSSLSQSSAYGCFLKRRSKIHH